MYHMIVWDHVPMQDHFIANLHMQTYSLHIVNVNLFGLENYQIIHKIFIWKAEIAYVKHGIVNAKVFTYHIFRLASYIYS